MLTRLLAVVLLVSTGVPVPGSSQPADAAARFELSSDDYLVDEVVPIVVSGLAPGARVTMRLHGGANDLASAAQFVADANGRVDVTHTAPASGSYAGVDAMGLFWSASRGASVEDAADDEPGSPQRWTLAAEVEGAVVARAAIRRRAVGADVKVTRVNADGLVGVFYEPPGAERHPAVMVLGGSGGGIPPASGVAGGLASRGYAAFALAYFGAGTLPRALENIPLEYFGTALHWLAEQPSVDPHRIGVVGASRGAEAALLIGSLYPEVRAVVAYMPSDVIWPGCCNRPPPPAWTLRGRPLAPAPMPVGMGMRGMGGRMSFGAQRPEIPVDRINGAVLLFSGKDDGVWPSAAMAERVNARLDRAHFKYPHESIVYEHTGHAIARPYASTMALNQRRHPLTGQVMHVGGTPEGTAKAQEDSWRRVLAFVDANLRRVTIIASAR